MALVYNKLLLWFTRDNAFLRGSTLEVVCSCRMYAPEHLYLLLIFKSQCFIQKPDVLGHLHAKYPVHIQLSINL